MKKRDELRSIFLILLSTIFLSRVVYAESAPIILQSHFPEPEIVKNVFTYGDTTYDSIITKSLDRYGAPGMPITPFKTVKILIPQDSDLQSIEIITGKKVTLDGRHKIEYGMTPVPFCCDCNATAETRPSEEIYSSTTPFPGRLYSQLQIQNFRGYKILVLNLYPVQYIPSEGLVSYFQGMTVKVNLKPALEISPLFRNLPKDKAEIIKKVDNPDVANTYTKKLKNSHNGCICDPCESYDYVIITNNELKDSNGTYTFQDLVSWKEQKGISATIVTVEQIIADPDYHCDGTYGDGCAGGLFNDTAARIRNFIKDAYINWGIEYVLLGGDGDGEDVGGESEDSIIPARGFYVNIPVIEVDYGIPADLYYASLDGNWNNDNDSYWGEDGEEDFYAEVYVGRAPVDSNEELSNFVNKTITYENISFAESPLVKALMLGLWSGDYHGYTGRYKDQIKSDSNADSYTTSGLPDYFNVTTLYDKDELWTTNDLINEINNETHIINHVGHSSNTECPEGRLDNDNVDNDLKNNWPYLMYSQGCYSAAFDNKEPPYPYGSGDYIPYDAIGEHHVASNSHAAFAYLGNSRFGWGIESPETDSASQRLDREFFDAIFGENIQEIGKANQDSKEDNIGLILEGYSCEIGYGIPPCYEVMKWVYYDFTLLGDPELGILSERKGLLAKVDDLDPNDPNASVLPADSITYTISFENNLKDPNDPNLPFGNLTNVTIIDYLPEEVNFNSADSNGLYDPNSRTVTWNIGTVEPNDSNSVTLTVTVNELAEPLGTIINICVIDANEIKPAIAVETADVNAWIPDVTYVDGDANWPNTGMSWENAYIDLQDALEKAAIGCARKIWVAKGTHKPTEPEVPGEQTFQLINAVAIYGGFPPGGGQWADRNPTIYETILNGDLNNDGQPRDLRYVVKASDVNETTIIDGFTITKGCINGVKCENASPAIRNNKITQCGYSDSHPNDAGIYCDSSDPNIINCVIEDNTGDGIYCENNSSVVVRNTEIKNNSSRGIYSDSSELNLADCCIENNDYDGLYCNSGSPFITNSIIRKNGEYGIYIYNTSPTVAPIIKNSWICDNGSSNDCGIYLLSADSVTVIRNTTVANNAGYGIVRNGGGPDPNINSCIVWNNGNDLYDCTAIYSCIEDNDSGEGNIHTDPCFVDDANDNYHLSFDSNCINAGDPNFNDSNETDIDGQPRNMGDCNQTVDIGADEVYFPSCWNCLTQCHGDADCDGYVGLIDFYAFRDAWNTNYCDHWNDGAGPYNPCVDVDRDGEVGLTDFYAFRDYWDSYPPADCNCGCAGAPDPDCWPPECGGGEGAGRGQSSGDTTDESSLEDMIKWIIENDLPGCEEFLRRLYEQL